MCCRYYFGDDESDGMGAAILRIMEQNYPGAFKTGEIHPGDAAPAIIRKQDKIIAVPAVFGFPGARGSQLLLNARSETAAQKRSFADCMADRRILLPASGFFEWGRDPQKTKYLFTVDRCALLYLCGIYRVIDGLRRFVIFTREANESMAETHDRMPVIVGADAVRSYLTDFSAAMELLATSAPALIRRPAGNETEGGSHADS